MEPFFFCIESTSMFFVVNLSTLRVLFFHFCFHFFKLSSSEYIFEQFRFVLRG
jgi:hypothetical protein